METLPDDLLKTDRNSANQLLSLSIDLAKIRSRADLVQLIRRQLGQFYYFRYCSILVLSPETQTYRFFIYGTPASPANFTVPTQVNRTCELKKGIVHQSISSNFPLILDNEQLKKNAKDPVIDCLPDADFIREAVAINLGEHKNIFGVIIFYSDRANSFKDQLPAIQAISGLIGAAVSNIMANEKTSYERETLLSLSDDLSTVRNKTDLLNLIHNKLKCIFYFSHSVVSIYHSENDSFTNFLLDPNSKARFNSDYEQFAFNAQPASDGIYNMVLKSKEPVILNLDELVKTGKAPGYIRINQETGIRELVAITLRNGEEKIGVMAFFSDRANHIDQHALNIIKEVSHQLSMTIANIMANEEIKKREHEKSLLLKLSLDMAQVRNREDLGKIINKKLNSLFGIKDYLISIIHENKKTHSAYVFDKGLASKNEIAYQEAINVRYPVNDGIFDKVLSSDTPLIYDLNEVLKWDSVPEYVPFWKSAGVDIVISAALRSGNQDIGVVWMRPQRKNAVNKINLQVLNGVSAQLASTVANVISYEEIERREKEKSTLLSLSHDIAGIRNKDDLFKTISTRLHNLFSTYGFVIGLSNPDNNSYQAVLIDQEEIAAQFPDFKQIRQKTYSIINDEVFNQVIASDEPVFFIIDALLRNPEAPDYIKFYKTIGLDYVLGVKLQAGDKLIGALWLNSKQEVNYNILKGVCAQISIAISNIKREDEKSLLLSFSNDIAAVRDKEGLGKIVKQYLKNRFQIREYIITIKNSDRKTYSYFLHDLQTDNPDDEGFKIITGSKMPIQGSLTGAVLGSEEPLIFDIPEILRENKFSFPSASFWKKAGAKKILGMRLRVANEDIGIIWTQPGQINDNLLTGISAQIAIATSNILANAQIVKQLEEINSYKQQLEEENLYLQEEIIGAYNNTEIIGNGHEMQKVFHLLSQVAFANSTVLLLGETGTGKELAARAIHNASPRKDKLMVKVNCAAMPANLIESELFGHERGSFTGAFERRVGKFELANKGTLFLDEIGELPLELQVKLLRAIQEKEIERVGGKTTIKVDVRIIAATNRNLLKEVEAGQFRSDLYYRLNVFPITLPPLRNRKEDIPVLASHFIAKYSRNTGKKITNISHKVLEDLMAYDWPGNVRELEHLVERSVLMTSGNTIKEMHLPLAERTEAAKLHPDLYIKTIDENERDHIMNVLQKCKGKVAGNTGAAVLLGVPVSTLNSKMKKLGIERGVPTFLKTS